MNFEDEKLEILREASALLKQYDYFSSNVNRLAKRICELDLSKLSTKDILNLKATFASDNDMKKFTRLALALKYVENPEDENVVDAMYEDVIENRGIEEEIELPEPIKITK